MQSGPAVPAPDFTLHDQAGETVTLSSFRGQTVVLTFLYTHCVTTCPLYSAQIYRALESVDAGDRVHVIAVTVDPERDTVDRLAEYTQEAGWPDSWSFLTGEQGEIKPILDSYRIGVTKREPSAEMKQMGHEGYEINHRAAALVINPQGWICAVLFGSEWGADDLAAELSTVLAAQAPTG
jgi:protein SCO1/2